jgi:DNA-binding winged helix-turn-helix (wHTH) protein/tetratricopeptide (TPR) repeat protein
MSFPINNLYRFEEFTLDPANRSLTRSGQVIPLSAKSCQVLTYLVRNADRVVTKDELLKAVWPESFVEESNLPGYVSGLRKALTDRSSLIATVPGLGYKFTAVVTSGAPPDLSLQPVAPANLAPLEDLEIEQMRETTRVVVRETSTQLPSLPALMPAPRPLLPGWAVWTSLTVLVLTAAAIAYIVHRNAEPQQLSKVVVADFLNLTGDPAFDHTLKTSLELSISQSPYIQSMSSAEIDSTLAMMQKPTDSPLLGDLALELCRRENYQALLRGKIAPGSKWGSYALSLEVVNCITGKSIGELHADAYNKDAILSALDDLALRARRSLGESAASIGEFDVPIMNESTFSFEALQAFNTGSNLGSEGKIVECIPYFQKAIELDPKFAMAQAGLGTAYTALGDTKKGADYSRKAFDLSAAVSQSERFYLRFNYSAFTLRDLDSALQEAQDWTRVYPRDLAGWQSLGYIQIQLGHYAESALATEHSLQLNAIKYESTYGNLADAYMREGRFAEAKRLIAESQAQNKDAASLHQLLLQMAYLEQDPQAVQREIQWCNSHPEKWILLETQAIFAADTGRAADSEALYQRTFDDASQENQSALVDGMMLDEAAAEVDLGEIAKAGKILAQIKDHTGATWAVLATKAGSTTAADAFLKLPLADPHGTVDNKVLIPELKAVAALHRNDPQAAIALLELSRPYELAFLEVIDVRAQAYLIANQPAKAAAEYQKLIDHPAVEEPTMPRTYLAHLGLARAYALAGRPQDSSKQYDLFFNLWKDADKNLPILLQAHQEYTRLPQN